MWSQCGSDFTMRAGEDGHMEQKTEEVRCCPQKGFKPWESKLKAYLLLQLPCFLAMSGSLAVN